MILRHPFVHCFSGWDINSLVDSRADSRANHPFLIWQPFEREPKIWTYREFAVATRQIASGLVNRGIRSSDKVLLHFENCPETILCWYACARIGAIALTTNARSAGPELNYFARDSRAVAAITQPKFLGLISEYCRDLNWVVVTDNDSGEPSTDKYGLDTFDNLYGSADDCPKIEPDPMRELSVQYTSGTTSRPKGVVWTHANALWGFRINALHTGTVARDIHLLHLPLFHTNAQAYSLGAALYAGASCVVMPKFSATRFWPIALRHRCTFVSQITFTARALTAQPVPTRHYFRLWGNAICEPPSDDLFGVRTMGWWGMTETMTHGIVGDWHQHNRSMMIGKAAPEYGVAILTDDGKPVQPGDTGHLLINGISGLSLFKEYLNNPTATTESFDEFGWFRTGDRVVLHEDGYIQFSDRDKDMLKVAGENVAASEIERVVLDLPQIDEVAVVGKKDAMRDQVPVMFVKTNLPSEVSDIKELIFATCRSQLADFKVPVEIIFVDDFPRSTLEKIAKVELRKLLVDKESGEFHTTKN